MIQRTWSATWITDNSIEIQKKVSNPPMTFLRKLSIGKEITQAIIYITSYGVYNLYVDNKRVSDYYLCPGWTSYNHQLQYQVYDITEQLKSDSEIKVVVGAGWAVGRFGFTSESHCYRERQELLAEIEISYADGRNETIGTDSQWFVTHKGNFVFADFYDGEIYDATIELETSSMKAADEIEDGYVNLYEHYGEYITRHEPFAPINSTRAPDGGVIYDFGQNHAGVCAFEAKTKPGQTIRVRHAEVLKDGDLFLKPLRTAKAEYTYICKGGCESYCPTMTFMGYRYVKVTGIDEADITVKSFPLYSDFKECGGFECSNEDLNKLQSNIQWGARSNFVDIPTDCPQRDERMGWTGDIAAFSRTACFNFDMGRFFSKWLLDLRKDQRKNGFVPYVIPAMSAGSPFEMSAPLWGDAGVMVSWYTYLASGNKNLLADCYESNALWVKNELKQCEKLSIGKTSRRLWTSAKVYGDWCAPDATTMKWILRNKHIATPFFANSVSIMEQVAKEIGKADDAAYYEKLHKEIIEAYNKRFVSADGRLKAEFQTNYVLPLYFNMVDDDKKSKLVAHLAELIKNADNHLATGFPGTPYILFALADNGREDLAYTLLLQDTCPSWLYPIRCGATTMWERWDAMRPDGTVNLGDTNKNANGEETGGMVSFNHYAYGAVGDFLYRRVAGIEAVEPGYKKFRIAPIPGGGLTYARAYTECPYGKIESYWKIENDIFTLVATVPNGTECTIILPDGTEHIAVSSCTLSCNA